MPRVLVIACLLLLAACGSGGALEAVENPGSLPAAPIALERTGRWMTDAQGRVVTLHGINITMPEYPTDEDLAARYADDAQFLAENGLFVVRLTIFLSGLLPAPGQYDDRYLEQYATVVKMLTDAGLYVMVDFHQDLYANKYHGRGMPDWMCVDDGVPNLPDQGNLLLNYAVNPAPQRAFDNFWNNVDAPDGLPLQDHYAAALRHVAARFRDNPRVLGYELMNEPFPGTQFATCSSPLGCPLFDRLLLTPFVQRMAAALRDTEPDKIVFFEPNVTFDFGADTWLGPSGDDNGVLSFHDYCLGEQFPTSPPGAAIGCDALGERMQFQNAVDYATSQGSALILTEFGDFNKPLDFDTSPVVERLVNDADEFMVPWAYWHYDGQTSYTLVYDSALPPRGDNVAANITDVLVRPYPLAVAGTPRAWSYSRSTGEFSLEYTTDNFAPGSVTEIVVPPRAYPHGYGVDVDGADVVSASGLLLVLSGHGQAGTVSVRVTR
jgi:endoglycosylceramidase